MAVSHQWSHDNSWSWWDQWNENHAAWSTETYGPSNRWENDHWQTKGAEDDARYARSDHLVERCNVESGSRIARVWRSAKHRADISTHPSVGDTHAQDMKQTEVKSENHNRQSSRRRSTNKHLVRDERGDASKQTTYCRVGEEVADKPMVEGRSRRNELDENYHAQRLHERTVASHTQPDEMFEQETDKQFADKLDKKHKQGMLGARRDAQRPNGSKIGSCNERIETRRVKEEQFVGSRFLDKAYGMRAHQPSPLEEHSKQNKNSESGLVYKERSDIGRQKQDERFDRLLCATGLAQTSNPSSQQARPSKQPNIRSTRSSGKLASISSRYIGKSIHIVTGAGLAYEGIFETASSEDSAVSLVEVRCLGNAVDGNVMPTKTQKVHTRIIFDGASIKELHIVDKAAKSADLSGSSAPQNRPSVVACDKEPLVNKAVKENVKETGSVQAIAKSAHRAARQATEAKVPNACKPCEWAFAPLDGHNKLSTENGKDALVQEVQGYTSEDASESQSEDVGEQEPLSVLDRVVNQSAKKARSIRAQQVVHENRREREASCNPSPGQSQTEARSVSQACGVESWEQATASVSSDCKNDDGGWSTCISRKHRRELTLKDRAQFELNALEEDFGSLDTLINPANRGAGVESCEQMDADIEAQGIASMTCQEVRRLLQRVKPMSHVPPVVINAAARKAVDEILACKAETFGKVREIAVWCFSDQSRRLGDDREKRALAGLNFFDAMRPLVLEHIEDISPVVLVYILSSYAVMLPQRRDRPADAHVFFRSAADALLKKLHEIPFEGLACLMWCFARAGNQTRHLLAAIAKLTISRCDDGIDAEENFSPKAVYDMLWACSRFSYTHAPLLQRLVGRLESLLGHNPAHALLPWALCQEDGPHGRTRVKAFTMTTLVPVVVALTQLRVAESSVFDKIVDYCMAGLSLPDRQADRFLGNAKVMLASAARAFVNAGVCRRDIYDLLKVVAYRRKPELRQEDVDEVWRCARQAAQDYSKQERAKSAPPPRMRGSVGRAEIDCPRTREV